MFDLWVLFHIVYAGIFDNVLRVEKLQRKVSLNMVLLVIKPRTRNES